MVLRAHSAWSDGGRIVVLEPDPRVLDAIDVALSPWNLRVRRIAGPLPSADIAIASAAVRVIADSEHAVAVVWVIPANGSQGPSLWVYDTATEQLVVRPLSVTAPFDDAGAAAVALTVKTIMRGNLIVEPGPIPSPVPAVAPAPTSPRALPPPPGNASTNVGTQPGPQGMPPAPTQSLPSASHEKTLALWRLEAVVGGRAPTGGSAAAEPQAALGVSVWPTPLGGHAGAGALVQAGPGTAIENAEFTGQFTQAELAITARARVTAGKLAFEMQTGPSLRLTSLDGAGLETGLPVHAVRLNPAFDAGAVLDVALGTHLALGALLDASAFFRFQRYTLNHTALFDEPTVDLLFGVRLAVEVD